MKIGDDVILISKDYNAPYLKEGRIVEQKEDEFLVRFYLEVDSDVCQDQWYELFIEKEHLRLT